ncbi:MAG TPA: DMT family transporter [bacterium]|nr:DMT family transporter [bacterium]
MPAELFALLSSLCYASSYIFAKKALKGSDPLAGVLLSVGAGALLLVGVALLMVPSEHLLLVGILIFALAGFCAPGLGRVFSFIAISRVGVSRSSLIYATEPLLTVVVARWFLGEVLTLQIILGTVLIILGVMNLSQEKREHRPWRLQDLLYAILATAFYGISTVIRKWGLGEIPDPLLGATVNSLSAAVLVGIFASVRRGEGRLTMSRLAGWYYVASGVSSAVAILFMFVSLNHGDVVVVSPLLSTRPLFAILLSFLFLRDVERVTWRIFLGGVLVVLGSAAITAR